MEISVEKECGLYGSKAVGEAQTMWMGHGDEVVKLPEGLTVVARSLQGSVAAIESHSRRFNELQYHPEVTHSPQGMETLQHFLFDVCGEAAGYLEEKQKKKKGNKKKKKTRKGKKKREKKKKEEEEEGRGKGLVVGEKEEEEEEEERRAGRGGEIKKEKEREKKKEKKKEKREPSLVGALFFL